MNFEDIKGNKVARKRYYDPTYIIQVTKSSQTSRDRKAEWWLPRAEKAMGEVAKDRALLCNR